MSGKQVNVPYVNWEEHLSPYRKPHYQSFREKCKEFVDNEILPNIDKWEKQGDVPLELYRKAYQYGVYSPEYPAEYGGQPFEGFQWDSFMAIERASQLARAGSGGLFTTLYCHGIAIPPVLHFGREDQKLMMKDVCQGKEIAVLAISEPNAGSDVAALECTAKKDGDYYIVNGSKKWISGGTKAKYFITAVRTGGKGTKGLSLLIIPKTEGVVTSRIHTQGCHTSHTTLIIFKDVKVPVSNLIGKENEAFKLMMFNFNNERMGIAIFATCAARVIFEEAIEYAKQRKTFGKHLIQHQVLRHKIAEIGRQILATYCLMETLAYQLQTDPLGKHDKTIGARIALFKVQSTKTLEFVARECSQILGGASYVIGKKIERIYRDVRALAIYGGSEEIMLDVSTRLAFEFINGNNPSKIKDTPYVDWENHLSIYATPRQQRWRKLCSDFVEKELMPNIDKYENQGEIPLEVYQKCYSYGIYAARYPAQYGGTPFENEPYDQFLNMILFEQLARTASGGLFASLSIHTISIPPVMHFGTENQRKMFRQCVEGKAIAALAISEPNAGSDVAALTTTARREGEFYVVNGAKKWISNGTKAKYFVTAVRTGEKGAKGISLLIIERTSGVTTSRIKTMGHHLSHTCMIYFDNVRVPVSNLIGKENEGFKLIMYNFNQERFGIASQAIMVARTALQESVRYAQQRTTFGKAIIEHQVIRHKIAEMGRHILATYCMMSKIAYQLQNDPLAEHDTSLSANICLFKVQATKSLEYVASQALQIFGGAGYVWGKPVEKIYRDVRAFAIYGGSEEIMLDVSVRLSKL